MAPVLLAVDLSYQTYRAAAAHPMLTCDDVFTGGLYGFLSTLGKMVRETEATRVVFCRDTKPYKRSAMYPQYKQLRKKSADDELLKRFTSSLELVTATIEALGHEPWAIPGFESDDLIAHAAIKYRHRFDRIYAGSNDSDLYQLLYLDNFAIYGKDIADVMTGERLLKTQGLTPEQHALMTAMTGTHNDVEGIPMVGPVTAKKAIADPALMRHYRSKWADVIDRNRTLIKLPHAEFPREARLPQGRPGFNARKLYSSLGRYDIDCTAAMLSAFEQIQPRD